MTTPTEDPYYNRRTRGTPFHSYRNRVSFAVLGAGLLIGVGISFLPTTQLYLKKIQEAGEKNREEFELRRILVQESLVAASYRMDKEKKEK